MNRIVLPLSAIVLAIGCDAVSITEITVRQTSLNPERTAHLPDRVTRVIRDNSARFGLSEFKTDIQDTRITFTDSVAGQNPNLWLTVENVNVPARIVIAEMYISSRTEKHKQLVTSLTNGFANVGLTASITNQTRDGLEWAWILVATIMTTVALIWWAVFSKARIMGRDSGIRGIRRILDPRSK